MGWFGRRDTESIAKERLKLILVQDRALLTPSLLNEMKGKIIEVISSYLEINQEEIEIKIGRERHKTTLEAVIPVKGVKKGIK
jgi:cell division topological specificity factor